MSRRRFLTYLAPSIPRELFELVVGEIGRESGHETSLDCETSVSGPSTDDDPFRSGRADFAFVCSPSYPELRRCGSAELVGAGSVFADPRTAGRPVYFADVVVAAAHPARSLPDLRGGPWTYNDPASLSGWHSLKARLAELAFGQPADFFREVTISGSHVRSLELVAGGGADASAIDSNALALSLARHPSLAARIRILESWGPLPIQPLLASASIAPELRARIASILLGLHEDERVGPALRECHVSRFAPVDAAFYDGFPILAAAAGGSASPAI